ncbi:MAG: M23 family metallopeptidase, partial [Chloroflexi bacterium]|nr:M23 family metallopeptidase [Chloroflexota bacterium]
LLVHAGQYVEQGQEIALMGSTGNSTGPHTHFIIAKTSGGYVNPLSLLP